MKRIWESGQLTNHGELSLELAMKLKKYLEVDNIMLCNNGTVPLQLALRSLGSDYEVITTPFSYIATSAAIVWQNCKPIFVDIDEEYLCINESLVGQAITSKTKAILVTHVFGNPCNIEALQEIATKYGLMLIFDAAHAFGVRYKGKSIFDFGDISTCSFHATKLFHTAEGGAVFIKEESLRERLKLAANFGHTSQYEFDGMGINAKMSELQAAMGLSVLPNMKEIIGHRKAVVEEYKKKINWGQISTLRIREFTEWNYSYFPIIFEDSTMLHACIDELSKLDIFPRRYFYPSLNTVSYLSGMHMPVSEMISERILCLPLSAEIDMADVHQIVKIINTVVHKKILQLAG
ncbi:MAG: DegT/DnrJ/EryC1/StrS family aminotransferase [Cyclobacteriaceae bacterium]